ncbi:hypothetical protein [Legionella sp. W05-934-2]|uniref:hypothetical protein n=1 Tax=Legionella sp. W05-934-2 TaxID=1198649 RepID=UPI003461A51F
MIKKGVILVSCLLASMPIFSNEPFKGLQLKSNHKSYLKSSKIDFSGIWSGKCNDEQQTTTMKITQDDKHISFASLTEDGENFGEPLYFPLSEVKSKSKSTFDGTENSLSAALWSSPNSLALYYFNISLGSSDHSTSTLTTNFDFEIELDNGKLNFIIDNYPENIVCVFNKQG